MLQELSILFVRFSKKALIHIRRCPCTFNSLCEILEQHSFPEGEATAVLSILFVRFSRVFCGSEGDSWDAFNSLCEILE